MTSAARLTSSGRPVESELPGDQPDRRDRRDPDGADRHPDEERGDQGGDEGEDHTPVRDGPSHRRQWKASGWSASAISRSPSTILGAGPLGQARIDRDDPPGRHGADGLEPGSLRDRHRTRPGLRGDQVDVRALGDEVLDRPLRVLLPRGRGHGVAPRPLQQVVDERAGPDRVQRRVEGLVEARDPCRAGQGRFDLVGLRLQVADDRGGGVRRAGDLAGDLDVGHQVVEVPRVERHDRDVEIAQAALPLVPALDREEQVGLEPHDLLDVGVDAEVAGAADLLDIGRLGRVVVERTRDADEPVAETEREHDLRHRGRERHDPFRWRVDRHRLAVVVGDGDRERGRRTGRRGRSRHRRRDRRIVAAGRDEQRQGQQRQQQGGADGSHARLLSCEGRPVGFLQGRSPGSRITAPPTLPGTIRSQWLRRVRSPVTVARPRRLLTGFPLRDPGIRPEPLRSARRAPSGPP